MRNSVFVAFDTETTGLYPGFDQIVEVAACRFKNGEVVDSFETLVNPEREISEDATRIHGITEEMVRDAPRAAEAVKMFFDFIDDDPLLAHNAPFDENFISFNCHRSCVPSPQNSIYDTLLLSRRLFPELKSHGLASLTTVFAIPHETKHRSMPDVMGTRGVFMECLNRLESKGLKNRADFDEWYGVPIKFSPDKYALLISLPAEYDDLRNAVEHGKPLEVVYEDRSGKRTKRHIEPLGIYVAYGNLYITAYCHLREANRNFKIERIHAFRLLNGV